MKFFFWAMLSNALLALILAIPTYFTGFSFSLLSALIFYGLILKGIFTLDKTETHFRTVMVLSVIMIAGSIIQILGSFINNDLINALVGWFAMVSSVGGIFAEYNLIKGIQSYKPVLNQPNQADKLMKFWKITLISGLVLVFIIVVAMVSFYIVIIMTYGFEQAAVILEQNVWGDLIMEAARANGVFTVILLVLALSTALVNITSRILMIVTMYSVSKDHRQVLSEKAYNLTVEQ